MKVSCRVWLIAPRRVGSTQYTNDSRDISLSSVFIKPFTPSNHQVCVFFTRYSSIPDISRPFRARYGNFTTPAVTFTITFEAMAPNTGESKAAYLKDEKALCFHGELLYEAKILDVRRQDAKDKVSPFEYRVHYKGWKNT